MTHIGAKGSPLIHHIVLLKFLDSDDISEALTHLRALPEMIPAIASLHVGADELGRRGAFDVVLITTHVDETHLLAYIEHPAHVEFLDWMRPRVEQRAAVDTRTPMS